MRLETLLPLGKVDPGLRMPDSPLDLSSVGRTARMLEDIGYDGLVVEETKDDPFVVMGLAAQYRELAVGIPTTELRRGKNNPWTPARLR